MTGSSRVTERTRLLSVILVGLLSPGLLLSGNIKDHRLVELVEIQTSPSKAMIYLDGKKIGVSPQSIFIERAQNQSHKITALPMFAHQYRQDLVLSKGSPPHQVQIFMDINPEDTINRPALSPASDNCNNSSLAFPTIYFETNKHSISMAQQLLVEQLTCSLMKRETVPMIRVYGHADERGSRAYNDSLAFKRALSVKDLLIEFGYPATHIQTFSYGKTMLKDKGLNPVALKENRRTYIEIGGIPHF